MKCIRLSVGGETNTLVVGVVGRVVVLKELLSDDGVDTRAATIHDPGVVLALGDLKVGILGLGDEVLVRGQRVGLAADDNAEVAGGLGGVSNQASVGAVNLASGSGDVSVESAGRNVDQGGTSVDDTITVTELLGAIREGGRNTPVRSGRVEVVQGASELAAVDTAEGEFTVGVVGVATRLGAERNTKNLLSDGTLRVQVVQEGRDGLGVGDSASGQTNGADTEDTVSTLVEAVGG